MKVPVELYKRKARSLLGGCVGEEEMDMTSISGEGCLDSEGLDFWDYGEKLDFLVLEEGGRGEPDGELITLALVLDLVFKGEVASVG
uniref:Uncharacterized protein n=1 Tax=Cucumis melo TaxID=3656 RepID=A0A9I9DT80_CUCME